MIKNKYLVKGYTIYTKDYPQDNIIAGKKKYWSSSVCSLKEAKNIAKECGTYTSIFEKKDKKLKRIF